MRLFKPVIFSDETFDPVSVDRTAENLAGHGNGHLNGGARWEGGSDVDQAQWKTGQLPPTLEKQFDQFLALQFFAPGKPE